MQTRVQTDQYAFEHGLTLELELTCNSPPFGGFVIPDSLSLSLPLGNVGSNSNDSRCKRSLPNQSTSHGPGKEGVREFKVWFCLDFWPVCIIRSVKAQTDRQILLIFMVLFSVGVDAVTKLFSLFIATKRSIHAASVFS